MPNGLRLFIGGCLYGWYHYDLSGGIMRALARAAHEAIRVMIRPLSLAPALAYVTPAPLRPWWLPRVVS